MENHPLYAEIVFDRPLDTAYSYAVPVELHDSVAIGKRVECPFGRGDKVIAGYCVGLTNEVPTHPTKELVRVLDDEALLDDHLLRLTRWMADYYLAGWGQVLHAVVPAGARKKAGTRNVTYVQAVPQDQLPKPTPSVTAKQKQAFDALNQADGPLKLKDLSAFSSVITSLVEKGLAIKFTEREESADNEPDASATDSSHSHTPIQLNPDQERVWQQIQTQFQEGGHHSFLLHGVTGSGKTEIYLRAIEEVVRQGKEAIVLVPEISLTPQTIERFSGRGNVAVLHSHLSNAERGAHWRRIAAGQSQVVVGARSAVFAPTRNLGLIVIDEEHENSFKQETTPRYHARDVAVMRAHLAGVPIILGSATPSLESWHNVEKHTYTVLGLPKRVADRPMPHVKLVDLRHEPKPQGKHYAICETLEHAMRDAMKKGGQVMLLLNRRGFSTHIHCPECGHVATCQNCDLALTFHRQSAALQCHYCGYETAPLRQCPHCEKGVVRYQGLGTEKLQTEIEEKFPDKVTQRMDSDTMSKPGSHRRVLDSFRSGHIDILMGTQMIAKGLDFPNVTLVGVINADIGLHMPDFRAGERTFQLLAQVAGRTGRGDSGGTVMVQTYTPEHPCIALAAKHDFLEFAKLELAVRREHGYPPYQRLARLIVRSEKIDAASAFADILAGAFKQATARIQQPVRVLGPAECPVFKLKNFYRFHFQLQSSSSGHLHQVLREVLAAVKVPSNVEYQVDIDPFNMM